MQIKQFTALKPLEIALKYAKRLSPERPPKCVKKFDFRMEPKITTLLPTSSRSLLSIRFVAVAFRPEEAS